MVMVTSWKTILLISASTLIIMFYVAPRFHLYNLFLKFLFLFLYATIVFQYLFYEEKQLLHVSCHRMAPSLLPTKLFSRHDSQGFNSIFISIGNLHCQRNMKPFKGISFFDPKLETTDYLVWD